MRHGSAYDVDVLQINQAISNRANRCSVFGRHEIRTVCKVRPGAELHANE